MKKIALLMALVLLVFGLAACAEEKNDPAGSTPVGSNPVDTQAPTGSASEEGTVAATVTLCEHEYKETVEQEATCTSNGVLLRQCTKCGESVSQEIPALGHQGSGASCEVPSFCLVCGEMDAPAWEHEALGGVCIHCGLEMDAVVIPEETQEETEAPELEETEE